MKHELKALVLLPFLLTVVVLGVACSSNEDSPTIASQTVSEDHFINAAESAAQESLALEPEISSIEDPLVLVPTGDFVTDDLGNVVEFTLTDNIDGMEVDDAELKDVAIVATEGDIAAFQTPELQEFDLYFEWETQLMKIWDDSINGVVLITMGNSIFPTSGTGAGWFWDEEGHIVTNRHVVQPIRTFGATTAINVTTFDGNQYEAELVGTDLVSDVAVLKIDPVPGTFNALPLGDSSEARPGMSAVALGHPFGADQAFSMTHGIVSGVARSIQAASNTLPIPAVIQTDADMNPGNSGGPLLNSAGEVIGVNTQIRSYTSTNSGVGFATPINLVRRVVGSIIETGSHEYPLIGVSSVVLTATSATAAGFDENQRGLLVTDVTFESPAYDAGIIADSGTRQSGPNGDGDIIVKIDNAAIKDRYDLLSYIMVNTSPGDDVVIEVLRNGEIVPLTVTLASWGDRFN